jgi:hypothetical protein
VERLSERLEREDTIAAVTRLEAVYLGPAEVLVVADVRMADGANVAAALAQAREHVKREVPAVARMYLTPVE